MMKHKKRIVAIKRIIQIVVGGVGWGFFFFPILLGGIFNIGTVAGVLGFGGLFGWGMFRPKLLPFLQKAREQIRGRRLTSLFCILFCCGLLLASVESALMVRAAVNAPPEDVPVTVLVLGCRVRGTSPSKAMRQRLTAAGTFLREHPDAVCVLSGGQGEDEEIAEADCMCRELTAAGIAPERLYREDRSTSTRENFLYSQEIIENNGLPETVVVVTNEYHQYRAGLIAKGLGMETYAVSAPSGIGLLPTYWAREWFGILYEWLF